MNINTVYSDKQVLGNIRTTELNNIINYMFTGKLIDLAKTLDTVSSICHV